jgi:acetyl esterase/lipase
VAVLLHGGFWRRRYGRDLMSPLAADLTRRGWATWNLEYRRVGPGAGGGWPGTFEDVAAGVDALADLPEREALDLDRVACAGHSAGGHLALWAAARPGLPAGAPGAGPRVRVGLALSLGGVVDLEEAERRGLGDGAVRDLLGGGPSRVPERYALASPAARLPLGVPQVLVHGAEDDTVPAALSEGYSRRAVAAGDPCELLVLPGVGHFEPVDPASSAWAAAVERLEAG